MRGIELEQAHKEKDRGVVIDSPLLTTTVRGSDQTKANRVRNVVQIQGGYDEVAKGTGETALRTLCLTWRGLH